MFYKMFDEMKSRVASGVYPWVLDPLRKKSSKLNFRGPVDLNTLSEEDRMRAMAEDLLSKSEESVVVAIESLEKVYDKEWIERFKKIVNEVKINMASDKMDDEIKALFEELKEISMPIRRNVTLDKFKEVVNKDASDIDIYANSIGKSLKDYLLKRSVVVRKIADYEKTFGSCPYGKVAICSDEEVKELYRVIAERSAQLEKEAKELPEDKRGSYIARMSSLDGLRNVLPNLMGDMSNFDKIRREVDESIKTTNKGKEDSKDRLYKELKDLLLSKQPGFMDKLRKLDYTIKTDIESLNRSVYSILGKYSTLSETEKNDIRGTVTAEVEMFPGVDSELFTALFKKDGLLDVIQYSIEPLSKLEFGKDEEKVKEFKKELINLRAVVSGLKSDPVLTAHGTIVEFNEDSCVLNIKIPSVGINYSKKVMDRDAYLSYQSLDVKKIVDEFMMVAGPKIDIIIRNVFDKVSRMEKPDSSVFGTLVSEDINKYKERIMALGISESNALNILRSEFDGAYEKARAKNPIDCALAEFIGNHLIDKFAPIKAGISELAKLDYSNPEFASKYSALQGNIKNFIEFVNNEENKRYGIEVIYDEDFEKLGINYHSDLIPMYTMEVLTTEALKAKNAAKGVKPAPTEPGKGEPEPGKGEPVPPKPEEPKPVVPPTEEQVKDQQVYIELMNITNDNIRNLNNINNSLLTFEDVGLTEDFMRNSINNERLARELDLRILSSKTELSTLRAEYAKKYKQLLFSNPEIKAMTFEKVKFLGSYKDFVQKHDRLIVMAELEIAKLAEEKKSNPKAAEEVMAKINLLLEFIDSQNSLIGRRMMAACQEENIDLLQALQERREYKNKLREELRKGKGKGEEEPSKVDPEPEPEPEPVPPTPPKPEPKPEPEKPEVSINNKHLVFNPRKVQKIDRHYSRIIEGVDTLTVSVIKNGLRIKYSRDLAEKLHKVKNSLARLALVKKDNYRVRKSTQLDLADDDTVIETEVAFKTKDEIDPNEYKVEIRNDDGVIYEYDLANLPEDAKGKSR